MIKALIDMDLIAYPVAAACNDTTLNIALWRAESAMEDLINVVQGDYLGWLTGGSNFRYKVDPEYKAHRKDVPKPVHLKDIREYLIKDWKAIVTDGYEADDAIGIASVKYPTAVICSLDKDLLQLPGKHYNWRNNTFTDMSIFQSIRHLFYLMLVGDRADNIRGVDGIGPVRANRILDTCETIQELQDIVQDLYSDDDRFFKNLRLITILTSEEEWELVKQKYVNTQQEIKGESVTETSAGQDTPEVSGIDGR